jgi:hypothetical protein
VEQAGTRKLYSNGPTDDLVDTVIARESPGGTIAWYLPDRLGTIRDLIIVRRLLDANHDSGCWHRMGQPLRLTRWCTPRRPAISRNFARLAAMTIERARRAHTARLTPKLPLGHMYLSRLDFRWTPD